MHFLNKQRSKSSDTGSLERKEIEVTHDLPIIIHCLHRVPAEFKSCEIIRIHRTCDRIESSAPCANPGVCFRQTREARRNEKTSVPHNLELSCVGTSHQSTQRSSCFGVSIRCHKRWKHWGPRSSKKRAEPSHSNCSRLTAIPQKAKNDELQKRADQAKSLG